MNDVADALRESALRGEWLIPYGGAGSLATGNVTDPAPAALDLTALRGIEAYVPEDLTLTVQAGTTFDELQAVLGEHGQEVPIDVPFPDRSTIGGLVATGFAGPRRLAFGTLKDLLIGATFVRGDGLEAKAGGLVVKNVSGFEIPRLLHGSWGALAVITSVNLKVVPRQRTESTITAVFAPDELDVALTHGRTLLGRNDPYAAITIERRQDAVELAVRIGGRSGSVREVTSTTTAVLGAAEVEVVDDDQSASWWQDQTDRWGTGKEATVQLAVGATPTTVDRVLQALRDVTPGGNVLDMLIQPGVGTIRVRFDAGDPAVRTWWVRRGEIDGEQAVPAIVEFAPVSWRTGLSVWGSSEDSRGVSGALKDEFDPHQVLNRGRLFV